jgi:hypothetical protein
MSAVQTQASDWQRIWLSIRQHGWTSLAIVPSHTGLDVAELAEALAATGRLQGQRPVTVVNAMGTELEGARQLIESINESVDRGAWVVVAVDTVADSPTSIAIIQAVSSALLVVRLGESLLGAAQATLDAVGRGRFLGSIVLDETSKIVLE